MGGLFAPEKEFRSRGLQLEYFHNEALEPRAGKLAFGIPYEILLGMLCHSYANVERAAEFFINLTNDDAPAVVAYLSGFISRVTGECDLRSTDLRAKPEHRHTAMDFPRPSSARMLVWDFGRRLARDQQLCSRLSSVPGADWFFSEVRGTTPTCKDAPEKSSFGRTRPLQIVMVNDESFILDSFDLVIRKSFSDVSIRCFEDSNAAWEELLKSSPDLLITDDTMPGMSGQELCRQLFDRNITYPIIVDSAWEPTERWVRELANSGFNVFLLRVPCGVEEIVKAVEFALKIKRREISPAC
jgi:CheY-like chemotaxis protein